MAKGHKSGSTSTSQPRSLQQEKLSYATVASTPARPLGISQAEWNVLLSSFHALQEENRALRARLDAIEAKLDAWKPPEQPSEHEVAKQIHTAVQELKASLPTKIQKGLREQRYADEDSHYVRVGGLTHGWYTGSFASSLRNIQQQLPEIDWKSVAKITRVDPCTTKNDQRNTQGAIRFESKKDRIALLRQSSRLKGTRLWIAEELTSEQLRHKKTELAKVYEARKNGKWAVFRNGKAVIAEFKKPKKPPDEPTSPSRCTE